MRLTATLLAALALLAALLAWASGAHHALLWWAAEAQRAAQAGLAARLQALRAGETAAFWSLVGICAAYGFLHALGPGHGKAVVAGAALGTRATLARMGLIAVAGSLGQAAVAILVVYGGFALFEATARGTVESADRWLAATGNVAIALVGAWLLARGLGALRGARAHAHGPGCGHAHAPSPESVARATGPLATLALIGAIAARPCTGALVVLVLAWRFGVAAPGAAAVVAMGLGTAAFTLIVAALAVAGRDAAFLAAGEGRLARRVGPGLQVTAGALILAFAGLALAGAAAA